MSEESVIREHGEHVRAFARSLGYYLPGAEIEDLEQEALIGLVKAWRSYDSELGPFWPHAATCIRSQLTDAMKTAARLKQRLLTRALRVVVDDEGIEFSAPEAFGDPRADIVELLGLRAEVQRIFRGVSDLSELERRAVLGTAAGYSYAELEGVGTAAEVKRIDNALQRGREKLRLAA
jgi:RNA polymerase sporulation-specific sigma factor